MRLRRRSQRKAAEPSEVQPEWRQATSSTPDEPEAAASTTPAGTPPARERADRVDKPIPSSVWLPVGWEETTPPRDDNAGSNAAPSDAPSSAEGEPHPHAPVEPESAEGQSRPARWMAIADRGVSEPGGHDAGGSAPNASPEREGTAAAAGPSAWLPSVFQHQAVSRSDERGHQADSPESSQWLPPEKPPEENPLATGAWLPAAEAAPPQDTESAPASEEASSPTSRWLPPGLGEPSASEEAKPAPTQVEWVPRAEPASLADGGPDASHGTPAAETSPQTQSSGEPVAEWEQDSAPSQSASAPADDTLSFGPRTRAVEAYCRELLGPETATTAAQGILNSLTRNISEDAELLQMTRTAAAERLTARSQWDPTTQVGSDCVATPAQLAARANGTLSDQDRSKLDDHLASCLICRAAEVRASRADRAFAGTIGLALSKKRS